MPSLLTRKNWFSLRNSQLRSRITSAVNVLRQQRSRHSNVSKNMEFRYLRAGTILEKLLTESQDLLGNSEKLLKLAIGSDEGHSEIKDAMLTLMEPMRFLDNYGTHSSNLIEALASYRDIITPMLSLEKDLDQTFSPLNFIQILFKVESSNLPEENQAIFTTLTNQIKDLHSEVYELFEVKFKALHQIKETVEDVGLHLSTNAKTNMEQAHKKQTFIRKSLVDLEKELEENAGRETHLSHISKSISEEVQKTVSALQSNDITGQKLEHIIEAISGINDKFSNIEKINKSKETTQLLNYSIQSTNIQAEMAVIASKDINHTMEEISKATRNVNIQVEELDKECIALRDFKVLTSDANGVVELLLITIDEVTELISTTRKEAENAYTQISPLGDMTSDMTHTLSDLSINLRVVALNAQIQAAKLGEGTGLETLAENVCKIADSAEELSQRAGTELDQLSKDISVIVDTFKNIKDEGLEIGNVLETDGEITKQKLHDFRDVTLSAMQIVGKGTSNISNVADEMLSLFEESEKDIDYLMELRENFLELSSASTAYMENNKLPITSSQSAEVDDLKNNYTMVVEHEVHEGLQKNQLKSESYQPGTDSTEIEFFQDDSSLPQPFEDFLDDHFTSTQPPPPISESDSPSSNDPQKDFFLKEENSDSKAKETPIPSRNGDFTEDNIELF